MLLVSVIVLGSLGLQRLPLEYLPEFGSNRLRIDIPYRSSSPQEVERNIARIVEEAMATLPDLEKISSTSGANNCRVSVEFVDGTDMELASVGVRDRVDRIRSQLPDDIEQITLHRWQTTDRPVFEFSVAWDRSNDELYDIVTKTIVPKLQRIEGAANIEIRGMDERQVLVLLDLQRMRAHNLDFYDLTSALRTNNINVAGGTIIDAEKKYSVRAIGEFRSIDEIRQVPIEGTQLVLSDVAEVTFDYPEKTNYQRLDKKDAVAVRVYKSSTANLMAVVAGAKVVLNEFKEMPSLKGMKFNVYRDQSTTISTSLENLAFAGIFGAILANLVLFFFLRKVRSTIIIGMAIPVSIIATFLLMYVLRLAPFNSTITLNIISLSGMMFAVGMLVDPAVVVLENIFRHKQEEGLSAREAAIVGAKEVSVAVISATATTIIVFVPMIFMMKSGMGRFMRDFGVTIAVATMASLLISLTLIPLASSVLFTGKERKRSKLIVWMSDAYSRSIMRVTRYPWSLVALGFGIALVFGAWKLQEKIDRSWMPSTPSRRMDLNLKMDRNFSLHEINAVIDSVENAILRKKQELEIETLSTNFSKRRANVTIYFVAEEDGKKKTTELYADVRKVIPEFPGVELRVGRMRGYGGNDMGVSVELKGKNMDILITYAEEIRELLATIDGVKDVDTSMERGDEEVQVSVDRVRAQKYGISSRQVAQTISAALTNRANSKFKTQDKELDIIVQLSEEDRVSLPQLENLPFRNNADEMVLLGSVADLKVKKGPQSIRRENRKGTITVFANTEQSGMWKVGRAIDQKMATINLPPGYSWSKGTNYRRMRETETESGFIIFFAVILIYLVMASLFESFIHPFTILFSVPFAMIGVYVTFYLTGTSLTTMAWLGIIVVCGLVVNNGIILIDAINKLRRKGLARSDAIMRGGSTRLRPILMTTLTTIIGLAPMTLPAMFPGFFGPQEGRSAMYAPVGLAIVGGLLTSTPLTLYLMPIFYVLFDDFVRWMSAIFHRVFKIGSMKKTIAAEAS